MAELLRRILDLIGSFFSLNQSDRDTIERLMPKQKPRVREENRPEELTIILPDNKEYKNRLYLRLREYAAEGEAIKKMWKERVAEYALAEEDAPHWSDTPPLWWIRIYERYIDRAQRQTSFEFVILLELLRRDRIDLKKFAENQRDKWHRFDPEIYRDACKTVRKYCAEAVSDKTSNKKVG